MNAIISDLLGAAFYVASFAIAARVIHLACVKEAREEAAKAVKAEIDRRNREVDKNMRLEVECSRIKRDRLNKKCDSTIIKNGDCKLSSLNLSDKTITDCAFAGLGTVQDVFNAFSDGSIRDVNPSARIELNNRLLKYAEV